MLRRKQERIMSQETTMTFRLDANLRKQFMTIAENMDMPAAQILRALMRSFIQRNKRAGMPSISAQEKEERKKAVEFAQASVALEGYTIGDNEKYHAQRFISGEIDLETFVNGIN